MFFHFRMLAVNLELIIKSSLRTFLKLAGLTDSINFYNEKKPTDDLNLITKNNEHGKCLNFIIYIQLF